MDATDKDLMTIFASQQRRDPCGDISDYVGTALRAMRMAYELGLADGKKLAEITEQN